MTGWCPTEGESSPLGPALYACCNLAVVRAVALDRLAFASVTLEDLTLRYVADVRRGAMVGAACRLGASRGQRGRGVPLPRTLRAPV